MARYPSRASRRVGAAPIVNRMLPLPDHKVRQAMISYHMALSALREKRGDFGHFATIAKVIVCSSHLFDGGFGEARVEGLTEAHDALERNVHASVETGVWGIDETTVDLFADLLTLHEAQLRAAPAYAVFQAMSKNELSRADAVRPLHREREDSTPVAAAA